MPLTRAQAQAIVQKAERIVAASATDAEAKGVAQQLLTEARLLKARRWSPYPWQHPHWHDKTERHVCGPTCYLLPRMRVPTQGMWLQLGGRGTGKTESAARYVNDHAHSPPCDPRAPGGHRILIIAPTLGDAAESCVTGLSGLQTVNPGVRMAGGAGGLSVRWPHGARARLLGAHTPDDENRLRSAGNSCLVWLEEVAAMRRLAAALEHSALGLRVGSNPHYVASTTPKPRPEIRQLVDATDTIVTRGRTEDAIHLDEAVRHAFLQRWAGTRLGRQELGGELLEDVEGALWAYDHHPDKPAIQPWRLPVGAVSSKECHRVIVAVDPPGGTTEAGIIVAGSIADKGYLLEDLSGPFSPERWGRLAVDAYHRHGAEAVAVETAFGGDMVISTIRTIDRAVPIKKVPTKVGKRLRAEPIQSIYEQGRIHHVGTFPALEDQMTTWVPGEDPESPDRLDALVHAFTYLLIKGGPSQVSSPVGAQIPQTQRRPGR